MGSAASLVRSVREVSQCSRQVSDGRSCAIFCCLSCTPCIFLPLCFAVTPQQRWQSGLWPPMCFSNLQPIMLAEAAAELLKSYCGSRGTDILMACLLLARCWCSMAGTSLSGGLGELYLSLCKSVLAVTSCTSLCYLGPRDSLGVVLSSCMRIPS